MTITDKQAFELQVGDLVEYREDHWPEGQAVIGRVVKHPSPMMLGPGGVNILVIPFPGVGAGPSYAHLTGLRGGAPASFETKTVRVIEKAPDPLFVNSTRDHMVRGDIVSSEYNYGGKPILFLWAGHPARAGYSVRAGYPTGGAETFWRTLPGFVPDLSIEGRRGLTLVVDGTTNAPLEV